MQFQGNFICTHNNDLRQGRRKWSAKKKQRIEKLITHRKERQNEFGEMINEFF